MSLLRQSTAVTIQLGPFLDPSNGVTEETGLTPAVELSKAGAAFAARGSSGSVSHDAEGWYRVPLDATDTGTLGRLIAKAHDSANHLPVWAEFTVVPAAVYDALVAGTDRFNAELDSTVAQADAEAGAAAAITAYGPPTNAQMEARTLLAASYGTATNQTAILGYVDCLPATWTIPGTLTAQQVWEYATRALTDKAGFTLSGTITTLDALNTSLSSTHGADSWATATGFSTHSAADVLTAFGTGDGLTALVPPTATAVADAVLARNVSNVEASAPEHSLCTVILGMLESSVSGTTWTIKRSDGSTPHATKTVATDADADPITGVS